MDLSSGFGGSGLRVFGLVAIVLAGWWVAACSSGSAGNTGGQDAAVEAGPDGDPDESTNADGRCVMTRETFFARVQGCLGTWSDTLASIDAACAARSGAPVMATCAGRITVGYLDSVGSGTRCTYDPATGAFLGGSLEQDTRRHCGGSSFNVHTEPPVDHCYVGPSWVHPLYCGAGGYGLPVDPGPARPVTFTVRNETTATIDLSSDGTTGVQAWRITSQGQPLPVHNSGRCDCPNHHCVVVHQPPPSTLVGGGGETTLTWDGRLWKDVEGPAPTLRCEQPELAPAGPMVIQVSYRIPTASGGYTAQTTVEAAFDNPPAGPVVVTVR